MTETIIEETAVDYPTMLVVCQGEDWMGSTLHIPAQELQDVGTLHEQRIIARDLPGELAAVFGAALDYLCGLAPGAWGASIIRVERREDALRLFVCRDAGKVALEPVELDLQGQDYLAFFDRVTSPEFLLDPETKTI